MPKQTLVITSKAQLSVKNGMLMVVKEEEEEIFRSFDDLQTIIIDNHSVSLTIPLLNKLSEKSILVVFCNEKHCPQSMLMDLESNSLQTKFFRYQIEASVPLKKQLWKQIIEKKIRNQSNLLIKLFDCDDVLQKYYTNVKSGDSSNREAIAANIYWKMLFGKNFIRDRYGDKPNDMLNYGYVLLRTSITRALMDSGLMPTIGIFHRNYYDSFPLSDDIMEPYRPFIDNKVYELFLQGRTEINKHFKHDILELFYKELSHDELTKTTASLANIFCQNSKIIYYPNL